MRIVLLGAPGSGKGTQAELLAERYKTPQIATGDLLREAVASGSALGRQAKLAMDAGQLVGDDIVLGIVQERIIRPDARNGFILDGFPRNLAQAEVLDQLLGGLGRPLDLALLLAVDVDALLQRLVGRRTCLSCGQVYNVYYFPPRIDGRCDACGGRLRHRADDNEETIGNRLRIYEMHTLSVIEYYRGQDKLRTVQGVGEISDIFRAVRKIVEDVRARARSESRADVIRRAIARQQVASEEATSKPEAAAPRRSTPGKTDFRKATPKKAVSKKATGKKATTKQAATGKALPTKATPRKSSTAKSPTGTSNSRKPAPKKMVPSKVVLKKSAQKKTVAARKTAAK